MKKNQILEIRPKITELSVGVRTIVQFGASRKSISILRRYWAVTWCKRIDILSRASGLAFENLEGGRSHTPGPATDLPYKGGSIYIK